MDFLKTFLLQTDSNVPEIKQEPNFDIEANEKEELDEKPQRKKYRKLKETQNVYKCEICFKQFKRNFSLKIHKRIHYDEKPFKCELCPMEFNQKSNYTKHKLIHLNQKPHKCDQCDNSFSQKSHLINHQILHAAEDIKPYKCSYCEKGFSNTNCLMKHVQIFHFGREMFKCENCDKIFVSRSGLKNHLKTHTRAAENTKNSRKRLDKFMIKSELENQLINTEPVKQKRRMDPKVTEPIQSKLITATKFGIPIVGTSSFSKFGIPIIGSAQIKMEPEVEIYELSD